MEERKILSDETLSRLLMAGGLVRVAALVGILAIQVASPDAALRWPLLIAALAVLAMGIAAEIVLRRQQRRCWRTQDTRTEVRRTDGRFADHAVRERFVDRHYRER
jgi:hypothetical protein